MIKWTKTSFSMNEYSTIQSSSVIQGLLQHTTRTFKGYFSHVHDEELMFMTANEPVSVVEAMHENGDGR